MRNDSSALLPYQFFQRTEGLYVHFQRTEGLCVQIGQKLFLYSRSIEPDRDRFTAILCVQRTAKIWE